MTATLQCYLCSVQLIISPCLSHVVCANHAIVSVLCRSRSSSMASHGHLV
jgi:hypothetical protein